MSDRTPRPSYSELAAARGRGGDFLAPGTLRSARPQPSTQNRESGVSFFVEIARFAVKSLIVVAMIFLATLAIMAALFEPAGFYFFEELEKHEIIEAS